MNWSNSEPLSNFVVEVITNNTSIPDETSRTSYDVCLVEKSNSHSAQKYVFEIYNSKAEAIQRAQFISEKSGLIFKNSI